MTLLQITKQMEQTNKFNKQFNFDRQYYIYDRMVGKNIYTANELQKHIKKEYVAADQLLSNEARIKDNLIEIDAVLDFGINKLNTTEQFIIFIK